MSDRYKTFSLFISLVWYKGLKFMVIMAASIFISSSVAYALANFPEVSVFPMKYDQSIPQKLVTELTKVQKLYFVKIGQEGYNHSYNESSSDIINGHEILKNYSLTVSYYIPTYEIAPNYTVPAELFKISYDNGGAWISNEKITYGRSTLNNSKVIAIQIENFGSTGNLENVTVGKDFEYLRLDDINTDMVEPDVQINRIYASVDFCYKRNCTLVIGVIPHILRMQQSDKNYLYFNKLLIVIGVMMMMPIYVFYFISLRLRGWFK